MKHPDIEELELVCAKADRPTSEGNKTYHFCALVYWGKRLPLSATEYAVLRAGFEGDISLEKVDAIRRSLTLAQGGRARLKLTRNTYGRTVTDLREKIETQLPPLTLSKATSKARFTQRIVIDSDAVNLGIGVMAAMVPTNPFMQIAQRFLLRL